jgi:hypothetical protein
MSKPKSGLRRRKAEWALLVEAWKQSGLSRAAFAGREGVHPGTFSFWASRLAPRQSKRTPAPREAAPSSFVPVRIRAGEMTGERVVRGVGRGSAVRRTVAVAEPRSREDNIEIALANGRSVRCTLAQAADPRLTALLAIAEGGRGC